MSFIMSYEIKINIFEKKIKINQYFKFSNIYYFIYKFHIVMEL